MMKYLTLTILLICLGCNEYRDKINSEDDSITTNNIISNSIYETKKKIVYEGDTTAYDELFVTYLDEDFPEEILFYSLIMANEYNNSQAHFDVFSNICKLFKSKEEKISYGFSEMAIKHLLVAYSNDHNQALDVVKKYEINESSNYKESMLRILKK